MGLDQLIVSVLVVTAIVMIAVWAGHLFMVPSNLWQTIREFVLLLRELASLFWYAKQLPTAMPVMVPRQGEHSGHTLVLPPIKQPALPAPTSTVTATVVLDANSARAAEERRWKEEGMRQADALKEEELRKVLAKRYQCLETASHKYQLPVLFFREAYLRLRASYREAFAKIPPPLLSEVVQEIAVGIAALQAVQRELEKSQEELLRELTPFSVQQTTDRVAQLTYILPRYDHETFQVCTGDRAIVTTRTVRTAHVESHLAYVVGCMQRAFTVLEQDVWDEHGKLHACEATMPVPKDDDQTNTQ